jgi:predicted Co/Zn/Cd cation transporter (cation efflux family)
MHEPSVRLPRMVVGTSYIELVVISEPYVVYARLGYMPVLSVQRVKSEETEELIIAPKSLSEPLESLRQANKGNFTGIQFAVRKKSSERTSSCEVSPIVSERISKLGYIFSVYKLR